MSATIILPQPIQLPLDPLQPPILSASQKRELNPLFVPMWSASALVPNLPLPFPADPASPPSPKLRYRSQYRPPDPQALLQGDLRKDMSELEIALHVIDFSSLEAPLARIYLPSHKGQTPFHPVSMFLAVSLRRELDLSWRKLARLLSGPHGAGWRPLLGFTQGQTPSASGLRYFFHIVGPATFQVLCPQFITLLRQHGLLSEHSTYPGDPPGRGVSISQDGMLHPARSRPSCQLATDDCYQPLPEPRADEAPGGNRPCRAREKGHEGCACDTPACQERCKRASALDSEARFIHYEGHNDKHGKHAAASTQQTKPKAQPKRRLKRRDLVEAATADIATGEHSQGINVFGYRSVVERVLDDRFAVAWNALSRLYPANTDERSVFVPRVDTLRSYLPDLMIGEWLGDSGTGYEEPLKTIYGLGALRMVDIRSDPSDWDPEVCLRRGYDAEGHPLCPHGYHLYSNGYDYDRQRAKWVCRQRCQKEPLQEGGAVQPQVGCPFLGERDHLGFITNVGLTLGDESYRLARDIPYGSDAWKARYGRRNLSESRNGQVENLGLKRMRSYGLTRNGKEVQLADFLINLRTLGRLVREATELALN